MSKYCGYIIIPGIVSIFSFMLDIWYLYKCGSLILPKLNTSSNIVLSKFVNDRTRKIVRNQLELNYCYRTWSTTEPRGIFFTVFIDIRFRHYNILESNQCVQLYRVEGSMNITTVKYLSMKDLISTLSFFYFFQMEVPFLFDLFLRLKQRDI